MLRCLLQDIVRDVRQAAQLMLNQLLQQLRSNAQLPVCLRVIGYLRRMDVFTEAELRVKFLQARGGWLSSVLDAVPDDDPYVHITKTVEACRVHLFDIITQYRAIFSDDDPLAGPPGEAAIFHGWVAQRVAEFLVTLQRDLRRGVGPRLDSLLGQCMYFGLSFSRVGADFRGQLAPLFQQVALEAFQAALQEAADRFQEDMNRYTLVALPVALGGALAPAAPGVQPGTLQPPTALLDFPPLACFLNHVLSAFNDLRLCCPLGAAQDVSRSLEDVLRTVSWTGATPPSHTTSHAPSKIRIRFLKLHKINDTLIQLKMINIFPLDNQNSFIFLMPYFHKEIKPFIAFYFYCQFWQDGSSIHFVTF